jgi:cysteinyl-tRNA synthetase
LRIFDTLSVTERDLDTANEIRIYVCGITVYDECHIGHARTIIVFDTFRRFLESQGMRIKFIQNFTDVDDKIINRARTDNVSADMISSKYIARYFDDFDKLNVKRANFYPKATEHILDMIELIKVLTVKNIAYVSKNGVYFSVSKFKDYGKLSKKKIEDLISGARIEIDESKKDPLDFALWKFANDKPKWPSPWGEGRPGWHLECSAMSLKYLGPNFEIHGGGRDLIFPHHENEIAQSESYTEKNFAKIWMHVGMVTINGEKMSKSLGNTKSVAFVLNKWGPNIIRLFCLSGHYSKPIDYSEDLLKETMTKWRQVENCYFELILASEGPSRPEDEKLIEESATEAKQRFSDALNSDFNTPLAISEFFRLIKLVNQIAASEQLTYSIARISLPVLEQMIEVLGLKLPQVSQEEKKKINSLIEKRNLFRSQKKFQEADKIRKEISDMGIVLIDHKTKTLWMKQEKIGAEN